MLVCERGRTALICMTILMILTTAYTACAVETGPVDRKWGLGWANGFTARLWLGGVWELSVSGGPNDNLSKEERHYQDTGYPPNWESREALDFSEDKRESGFVELQAGRLLARRGPLAAVGFLGLNYNWSDSRNTDQVIDVNNPDDSYFRGVATDESNWTLTMGLRPSFEVLDTLTLEAAFWLAYRWKEVDRTEWFEYPSSGQLAQEVTSLDGERFFYGGWSGMGSLQIIFWF